MITDPVTTPNAPKARLIWAGLIGVVTFFMTTWWDVFDAPIWALFFVTPVTVVLDKYLKYEKFQWLKY